MGEGCQGNLSTAQVQQKGNGCRGQEAKQNQAAAVQAQQGRRLLSRLHNGLLSRLFTRVSNRALIGAVVDGLIHSCPSYHRRTAWAIAMASSISAAARATWGQGGRAGHRRQG